MALTQAISLLNVGSVPMLDGNLAHISFSSADTVMVWVVVGVILLKNNVWVNWVNTGFWMLLKKVFWGTMHF